MIKNYFFVLSLLLTTFSCFSQKIKGNKIPESKIVEISEFKILEVSKNFDVLLVQQEIPRVRVEADENLHQYVSVEVNAEKLEITTTVPIARFKKLYVEVGYNETLSQIVVKDKVTIRGNTVISTERMELVASNDVEAELHFKSDRVDLKTSGKTKINSNIDAENISITTNNDSDLKSEIKTDTIAIQMNDKSEIKITGTSQKCNLFINDGSELENSQFVCATTEINIKEKSKVFINTTDKLKINASGDSETYILGNPLINLESFNDEAKLIKMENPSSSTFKNIFSNN